MLHFSTVDGGARPSSGRRGRVGISVGDVSIDPSSRICADTRLRSGSGVMLSRCFLVGGRGKRVEIGIQFPLCFGHEIAFRRYRAFVNVSD